MILQHSRISWIKLARKISLWTRLIAGRGKRLPTCSIIVWQVASEMHPKSNSHNDRIISLCLLSSITTALPHPQCIHQLPRCAAVTLWLWGGATPIRTWYRTQSSRCATRLSSCSTWPPASTSWMSVPSSIATALWTRACTRSTLLWVLCGRPSSLGSLFISDWGMLTMSRCRIAYSSWMPSIT